MNNFPLVGMFLLILLLGCKDRTSPDLTERDAVDLGYTKIDCSRLSELVIYARSRVGLESFEHCRAAVQALEALDRGEVPQGVDPEYEIEVVVIMDYLAVVRSDPSVLDTVIAVTIDLVGTERNLRTDLSLRSGSVPELDWVTDGLQY